VKTLPILALLASFCVGCSTGEGPKQYNLGDTYIVVCPTRDPVDVYLEMYNQKAESSTGRDRTTKPTADLTIPLVPAP
jgi:hypothetical protein